jgi:demethylspheroidene O-methyltransferase
MQGRAASDDGNGGGALIAAAERHAMTLLASLRDRVNALRDRLAAKPEFRDWAARFPLTRPVARRRARQLFDVVAGFVYSQILYACVRLKVFDLLHEAGPQTAAAMAPRLGLTEEAAARLLGGAVSLELLVRRADGRFALGPLGAAMIGNPGLTAMVEHHAMLYGDLADPLALLRGEVPRGETALARYWAYARAAQPSTLGAEAVGDYTALMGASQASFVSGEVLDAYPDMGRRHRTLLDMGGGDGSFLMAAGARHPALRLMLFDLPAVAERARARFAAAGLGDRATAVGGSFFEPESVPRAVTDLVSLVRVVHDHDDDAALAILRAARRALAPGGHLLIAEPMAGTPGAEPAGEAYFGFYLLAMGSGRPRTPAELTAMLRACGFREARLLPTATPLLVRVLLAEAAGE